MQVEQYEINGFVIDKFNQYGLEVGKTQGVCPWSNTCRQPKNHKKKCSSYDWERGLGTCHNCNKTYQLHTYQRKGATDKDYVRPVDPPKEEFNIPRTKVAEWFKTRGISTDTLIDLQVSEGSEYMPQTGKIENTIKFNYYVGDQLINCLLYTSQSPRDS